MTILEILEAHTFGHSLLTVRGFCDGCDWHSYTGPKVAIEVHRAHVAEVLEKHMQEREAKAWIEAKNVIRDIPYWYADPDHHGFDLWEDEHGMAQENGARIEVMKILENNPFTDSYLDPHADRPKRKNGRRKGATNGRE